MLGEAVANTSSDQIVLALIAVIAASVGALVFVIRNAGGTVKDTNRQVTEVNKAVNNIGPGEHRLYDKVDHIYQELGQVTGILQTVTEELKDHRTRWEEFHARWGSFPDGMDSAADLAITLNQIKADIQKVQDALKEHVEWEMGEKYVKE